MNLSRYTGARLQKKDRKSLNGSEIGHQTHRFHYVSVGARIEDVLNTMLAGAEDDDWRRGEVDTVRADTLQNGCAVDAGEAEVKEDHVRPIAVCEEYGERLFAVFCDADI